MKKFNHNKAIRQIKKGTLVKRFMGLSTIIALVFIVLIAINIISYINGLSKLNIMLLIYLAISFFAMFFFAILNLIYDKKVDEIAEEMVNDINDEIKNS